MKANRLVAGAVALGVAAGLSGYALRGARADIPTTEVLRYAGQLEDANGNPLVGTKKVKVTLYDAASGGTVKCVVAEQPVDLDSKGRFEVGLSGCVTAVQSTGNLWLEVAVEGEALGRTKLGAVPYAVEAGHALNAKDADHADLADQAAAASGALKTTIDQLSASAAGAAKKTELTRISEWQSYTPQLRCDSTPVAGVAPTGRWRRVGDSIELFAGAGFSSSPPSCNGAWVWTIPTNLVTDTAKLNSGGLAGSGTIYTNGVLTMCKAVGSASGVVMQCHGLISAVRQEGSGVYNFTAGTGVEFHATLPIVGWTLTTPVPLRRRQGHASNLRHWHFMRALLSPYLRTAVALSLGLSLSSSFARPAWAQQPSMQEKSESHALFERALTEYKASRYKEALPLFQASQQLDPGVGTLMYMGECFRQLGQTASAWGAFKEAATLAVKLGDKRDKLALEKAGEIEKLLSYLTIEVPTEARVEGLEIKRDGKVIAAALWGTSVPVDPGELTIEARAPGKKLLAEKVSVGASGARVVHKVKPLEADATARPDAGKAEPRDNPKKDEAKGAAVTTTATAPTSGQPAQSPGPWRTVGFAVGGVGLATGIVGGVIALGAVSKAKTSDTAEYNDAKSSYNTGLIVAGVGGALLVGGVVLVLLNPARSESTAGLRWAPAVGTNGGGLQLSGRW